MSTAEIKEMAAKVKQNLLDEPDWGKVESGVIMSVSLNEPKMNAELLNGCRINNDGSVVLNSFMSENEEYGPYIFFNLFLLSPQDPALHKSLLHENVKKLVISSYKPESFPDDLTMLKSLDKLILDIDYNGFPDQVYELKNLKSIDINTHEFTSIPKRIFSMQNLEALTIRPAVLEFPDGFSDLKKLKHLDVNCSKVETVSSEFLNLGTLQHLHLRSEKSMIPREFDEMFRLNYTRPREKKINIFFQKI